MGEGGGESINFKTKRHNCASAHHSLNVRYNVKRSQLKQRQKKGGGGGSGVASSSLLLNPSDQYFFALSALNKEALHYREGYQSWLSSEEQAIHKPESLFLQQYLLKTVSRMLRRRTDEMRQIHFLQPNGKTNKRNCIKLLILYILTSVCIFSILFSIHFLGSNKENL